MTITSEPGFNCQWEILQCSALPSASATRGDGRSISLAARVTRMIRGPCWFRMDSSVIQKESWWFDVNDILKLLLLPHSIAHPGWYNLQNLLTSERASHMWSLWATFWVVDSRHDLRNPRTEDDAEHIQPAWVPTRPIQQILLQTLQEHKRSYSYFAGIVHITLRQYYSRQHINIS